MNSDREDADGGSFQLDLLRGEQHAGDADRPRIRVSRRARRLAVRVYPDARVEVVVPPRVRPREVESFIAQHREWIDEKRAAALARRPPPEAFPPASISFALTGETWRVHVAGGAGRVRIKEMPDAGGEGRGGILTLSGGQNLRPALRAWLLRTARQRLEPRVATLAGRSGVPFSRISIRRQRSRWGSCSTRGTISLNACLLFQRAEVVDYLIVHELMHVRHMNHSARFWEAVERHCPGWRALDRELLQGWRLVQRWIFSDS
jgi:predicted metal-dependent hydrolase